MDDRPLKIEMVLPTLEVAGMEVMAAGLSRALTGRGHDVGFTCLESGGALAHSLLAEGYRVAVVPTLGLRANVRAPRLASWFQRIRPDVVHVHSGVWLKAARAARGVRKGTSRVVHTLHGVFEREPWHAAVMRRSAARYTDRIVAVSESLREYLIEEVKVDRAKVRVILNGVNTTHFQPGRPTGMLRRPLCIDDARPVIGSVARLDPIKNHALLLDAFALVRAHVPEATLVLIGEGPLREELEAQARALDLDRHVHFFGALDNVAAAYRDFDLFVLPSRIEGTSMSILEAMASGVAVITTAVGGSPDLLDHGRCGILVPPGDPAALAVAMTDALRDGARRRALAATARDHVIAWHSEDAMSREYEAVYYGDTARAPARRELMTASGQCAG